MSREPRTTVPADTLRALNEQLLSAPDGFDGPPQAQAVPREAPQGIRGGRPDRLGPRRGAGLRLAAGPGRARPPHRPGHRARHVQPAPPRAPRRRTRATSGADPEAARRGGAVRAPQQPALRAGLPRLRVRLQRAGARRARALGGAVRRLRELGAGDRRPVHGLRPRQVGPDVAAIAAAPPRLRGLRARALERAPRALPPVRAPRATSAWPTAPRPRSTSTCSAARRWCRSRGRSW